MTFCWRIPRLVIVQGGVDEDVMKALSGKEKTQESLLNALRVRLERARKESCV